VLLLSWGTFLPAAYGEDRSFSDTKIAAEKGDAESQFNLGVMYRDGEGTPQDYVLAHKWPNLAAASGNKEAADSRDTTAKMMTPQQISEAQKMARE